MKTYIYNDGPSEKHPEGQVIEITEQGILAYFWEYWRDKCHKRGVPVVDITKQRCIEDFVIVYWAWEKE